MDFVVPGPATLLQPFRTLAVEGAHYNTANRGCSTNLADTRNSSRSGTFASVFM